MAPSRDGLGIALEAAVPDLQPWVVTADLVGPLGLTNYRVARPDRLVNTGVAEQLMVAVAAGIASQTGAAICATFASFLLRATEQLRSFLVIDQLPVLAVGSHAGFSAGPNGVSHHALDDLAVLGGIGLECWSPATGAEAATVIGQYLLAPSPRYVRLSRWAPPDGLLPKKTPTGPAAVVRDGDIDTPVLLSHGVGTLLCMDAADHLARYGFDPAVVHVSRVHPLPVAELAELLDGRSYVVVEDHFSHGGLGERMRLSALGERLLDHLKPQRSVGSDDPATLHTLAGIAPDQIAAAMISVLKIHA